MSALIEKVMGVLSFETVCKKRPTDAALSDVVNATTGNLGNLEVVLYNRNSIYGRVHTLRNSPDPVAVAIANQELLELLHLAPNIYDPAENTTSVDTAQALSLTQ